MKANPYCSSLACPRLSDIRLPDRVPTSQLSKDNAGHSWCNLCERQRLLMNWAMAQGWPAVRVQGQMRYAIFGGADEWFTSMVGARKDMVDTLYETLIEQKRGPVPFDDNAGVESVKSWLKAMGKNAEEEKAG